MRETALIIHFIGLTMGLGTGFAFMFLGMKAKKMDPDKANQLMADVNILNRMGDIGSALLILSGGFMMTPYWFSLYQMPTLMAKLVGVVILMIIVAFINIYTKKGIKTGDVAYFQKVETLGKVSLPLGVIILVLAVLTFH